MSGFFRSIIDALARIDMRAWFGIGLFALAWRILEIIAERPELLESAPFMQLITPIMGAGGLLLIATFLFGSNKESAQKTDALQDNARQMREAGIPVGRQAPVPVRVDQISPYAEKTDPELIELLEARGQLDARDMKRDQLLARLAELDAQENHP